MITKYYTTKNGKKAFRGYRARPVYNNEILEQRCFGPKEKTKAQMWHDSVLNVVKKDMIIHILWMMLSSFILMISQGVLTGSSLLTKLTFVLETMQQDG